ncbi:uncharacterized protein TNCV_3556021 [Trichonephila clavipes]|nr:uncharacterized protein TNCV_3556021 [Trichonephila clavipes]
MTEDAGIVTKKKRAVLRTAVTKCISQLEKELQKTEPDDIAVEELLEHLEQKFECLKIVDKECGPLYSPTEIDKEIEAVEQYFDKIVTWRFRAKKQLGKNNKFKSDSDSCKTTEESKLIEPMKGLLGSSALATVEGFAITAENYAKAVEILKDRFGRKDAIINSHM